MGIIDKIKMAIAFKRVSEAVEKENMNNHDWAKTGKAVAVDFALTSVAVIASYFSDPTALAAVLGVVPEHLRLALVPILSAGFVALRKRIKHGEIPPSAGPDLKAGALAGALALALLAGPAVAQEASPTPTPSPDAMAWLTAHSSIVTGTYSTDASDREEFVGLRIAGDFDVAPKVKAWAQVDLFTRSRDGQSATPALPSSPAGLAVYSSGEVRIGAYRTLSGLLSAECIAGATFAMPTLAGPSVDPLDGTKILGGCGLRVGTRSTYVRAIGGHFGPVVDGGVLAGFVPSLTLGGRVPIRDHLALTPEVSIGRNTLAQRTTYAARIAFVAF